MEPYISIWGTLFHFLHNMKTKIIRQIVFISLHYKDSKLSSHVDFNLFVRMNLIEDMYKYQQEKRKCQHIFLFCHMSCFIEYRLW